MRPTLKEACIHLQPWRVLWMQLPIVYIISLFISGSKIFWVGWLELLKVQLFITTPFSWCFYFQHIMKKDVLKRCGIWIHGCEVGIFEAQACCIPHNFCYLHQGQHLTTQQNSPRMENGCMPDPVQNQWCQCLEFPWSRKGSWNMPSSQTS